MKRLLIATAVIEASAGLALLCIESATVRLLLGSPLDTPAAVIIGRLAGAAILALGVTSAVACRDVQSRAAKGFAAVMTFYNFGVTVLLAAAGVWHPPIGVLLWPAVALHTAMTIWCIASLLRPQPRITNKRNSEGAVKER